MEGLKKKLSAEFPDWLINSSSSYLVATYETGEILFANHNFEENFLSQSGISISTNFMDILHPLDIPQMKSGMLACTKNGRKSPFTIINKNRVNSSNKYKSIKWECSILNSLNHDKPLLVHLGHDVVMMENESDYKSKTSKSLNELIDDLQIGVVIQDVNSNILLSNRKAEELLGVSKNDLHGRPLGHEDWEIIREDETVFPPQELPVAQAIATKKYVHEVMMGVYNPEKECYLWFLVDSNPDLDEDGEVERVATTFIDVSERIEAEKALKAALSEKTTLLSEIHHRVKNNLAIVSGLLELQSMEVEDPIKIPLKRSINRIQSIAMVHELMYQTEQLSSVNLKNYLDKLIPGIQRTMESAKKIKINLDIQKCEVNINQAIPLGLLMNELLTNSYKYAFMEDETGEIDIAIKIEENELSFSYKDSGPGFKHDNDFSDTSSLGLSLINAQLEQLHADYIVNTEGCFELSFSFCISKRGPHSNIR